MQTITENYPSKNSIFFHIIYYYGAQVIHQFLYKVLLFPDFQEEHNNPSPSSQASLRQLSQFDPKKLLSRVSVQISPKGGQ